MKKNFNITTDDERDMRLYLNANKLVSALSEFLDWESAIYNGKNYNEGVVLYKGVLYPKNEWDNLDKNDWERDENGCLVGEVEYLYTEKEILNKLECYLEDVRGFINDYLGW